MADDSEHDVYYGSSEESEENSFPLWSELDSALYGWDPNLTKPCDNWYDRYLQECFEKELRRMSFKLFVEKQYKDQVEEIVWGNLTPKIYYFRDVRHGGVVLKAGDFTLPVDTTQRGWQKCLIDALHMILHPTIHILILGEPLGLEEDLANDFALVAKQAGVDTQEFYVSEETEQSVSTSEGMFVLLSCPTVQYLNESLKKYLISSPANNIKIYYAGHSDSNGDWWLGEDNFFSGRDLKQLIVDVQKHRTIDGTIVVLINSCYGLKFVEDALVDLNEVQTLENFNFSIQRRLDNLIQKQQYHELDDDPILKDINIAACKFSIRSLCDSEDEMHSQYVSDDENREANSIVFTKIMFEMYRSPLAIKYGEMGIDFPEVLSELSEFTYLSFRLIPFSLESLDARGVLFKCFGVSPPDDMAQKNMLLKRNKPIENLLKRNLTSSLAPTVQPTIYAFPAGNGDSTLIRYDGINILIDGGIYKQRPCFWPIVSRLPENERLDVVILTHQDIDHLNGILALIERAPPNFIGALFCLKPPPPPDRAAALNRGPTSGGTEVWEKAEEKRVAHSLGPCCIRFENPNITLHILAPNETDARNARKCMTASRALSAPNRASAVVYLGIEKDDKTYRALFTGDAPSRTVVNAIQKQLSESKLSFDYVDVPHHGSKLNKPDLLFQNLDKCGVAVISTNGKQHGHPHKVTLDHLASHMQEGKIGKIGFTYSEHQSKKNSDPLHWIHEYERLDNFQGNCVYAENTVETSNACLKVVLKCNDDHSITSEDMLTTR